MAPFNRQTIPVRLRHLETPTSYLRRLCVANSIDHEWMVKSLRRRRLADGLNVRDRGDAIAELGGPAPERFEAAHAAARMGHANPRGPWDKQAAARTVCLYCTAGERVTTYPHIRFQFCLRHGTWLGSDPSQQRHGVMDRDMWKSERAMRRLVTHGHVDRDLYATAWELIRDNAYLVGEGAWTDRLRRAHEEPRFAREVDDRIAMFPETIRVLRVAARPEFAEKVRSGRRDATQRRAYLYRAFAWAGPERWVLCEGIDQFFNRDDE